MKNEKLEPTRKRPLGKAISVAIAVVIALGGFLALRGLPSPPHEILTAQAFAASDDAFFSYEITRYPASVEVLPVTPNNPVIGFTVDTWNLGFGSMPANGSKIRRTIKVANPYNTPVKIKLAAYGAIAPLVNFPKNYFMLAGFANTTVDIFANSGNVTGNFTGEIDVIAARAKHPLAAAFLWAA